MKGKKRMVRGGEGKGGYPILYTAGMDTTDQKYTADCGPGWEIDNTGQTIFSYYIAGCQKK